MSCHKPAFQKELAQNQAAGLSLASRFLDRSKIDRSLLVVVVAFLALAAVYNVVTPPFEALDEFHHYPYVRWVAGGRGLPDIGDSKVDSPYRQEGGQPPLYYLIAAAGTFWTGDVAAEDLYESNPHAAGGWPGAPDNKNLVLHAPGEGFPYSGELLGLHLARLLSTLMGLVTVVATYYLARRATRGNAPAALAAAAFVAFNPMFLFVAGSVNNDNLINALASLTLLTLSAVLMGNHSRKLFLALGVLTGAAALSKLSGLALLPLSLLVLAVPFLLQRRWKEYATGAALVTGPWLAIAGWWYARNWFLYGDPLGLNAFLAQAGGRTVALALGELEGLRLSFWGVLGGFNVLIDPLYWLYDALAVLAIIGCLCLLVLKRGKAFPANRRVLALNAVWMVILSISLARWTSMTLGSQGRLLFPGIASVALFFAIGLFSYGGPQLRRVTAGSLAVTLAGAAAIVPFLYIAPAYPPPAIISAQEAARFTHPSNINYDGKLVLLGYDTSPEELRPGKDSTVVFYWQVLATMPKNYSLFIHFFGRDGLPVGQHDTFPGGGSYPTSLARPGDYLRDTYRIRIASDVGDSAIARIEAGFYDLASQERLQGRDGQGRLLGTSPLIARLKIPRSGQPPPDQASFTPVKGAAGEHVSLTGYRPDTLSLEAGARLKGELLWEAVQKPPADYTVFVQMVGPQGLLAQYDSQPQAGHYPTSFWDRDEQVRDSFEIAVPSGAAPGSYQLIAGMYDLRGGSRLLFGGQDHVVLAAIEIRGGRVSG